MNRSTRSRLQWVGAALAAGGLAACSPSAPSDASFDAGGDPSFDAGYVPASDASEGGVDPGHDGGLDSGRCAPAPEACDGLDNDCDGVADDGLAGCDSCAPTHHELPVVTHWSNAARSYEYLAADQIDLLEPYPSGQAYQPGACYYAFRDRLLPDYQRYIGDTFAIDKISDPFATGVLRQSCADTHVPVKLLRPDAFESRGSGPGRLLSNAGVMQVLHGKVIDGSLATIYLPPNWSAAAPPGTYPIVANGFYDLNQNVFRFEGPTIGRIVSLSGTQGRTGAIGVLWNGGGAVGSRTMNENAFKQFHSLMAWVDANLGGDRHRVLMTGGSRGGFTAIAMASNPFAYDYKVVFASPAAAPARIGEHASFQGVTYPGMFHAVGWSTGLADAWRTSWRYPACAGKNHLTGRTGPEAHLHVLTGTFDFAYADDDLSPASRRFVDGLKAAGTQVYMTLTGHDDIVPFAHQVEHLDLLRAAGVPVEAELLVRSGHRVRIEAGPLGPAPARINRLIDALLPHVAGGAPYSVRPGVHYYRSVRGTETFEAFVPDQGKLPFAMDAPAVAVQGQRFPIVLAGEPGTEYILEIRSSAGLLVQRQGAVNANFKRVEWVDVGGTAVGSYSYALQIRKSAAHGWKVVADTETPTGAPATVQVFAEEPNVSYLEASSLAHAPGSPPSTNWGLSEY